MSTTTERTYIFNRETLKIELHFSKPEYLALSQEQKQLLKSNFLFSGKSSAWVSRAKEPNLYHAKQAAAKLGFTQEQRQGERLSFAEQVERQAERAEARAERFESYADNAERRAQGLQSEFNSYRGDIAFFTQPIIAGHSGCQAFARRRERIYARYDKGFEEYRKSQYFRDRAATARNTADMKKFKDPIYLDNRIKECKKNIRAMEKNIIKYEEMLYSLENHTEEKPSPYFGRYTAEQVSEWIEHQLERIEAEIDKQAYMENCLDEIGGVPFSQENIKPGYIVKMRRWGRCEIISAGPVNVTFKILDGGAAGGCLTEPYAAVSKIIAVKEVPKVENPFKVGDILCKHRPADDSIYRAYQVVKVTATGVKIQQIAVENGKPIPGQFTGEKAKQKKVVKSKFSDWVGVWDDDWQLHKYAVGEDAS
jgi:hypothetical protein